ncbi:MAG: hypothetical protein NZO58_13445 [Gemmataceae bacterium]|nr:hypothetical protein [Gemmataceae bacterium]
MANANYLAAVAVAKAAYDTAMAGAGTAYHAALADAEWDSAALNAASMPLFLAGLSSLGIAMLVVANDAARVQ